MTMTLPIQLRIASNVALVELTTVTALRGCDRGTAVDDIESGALAWCWDFSADGASRRELRVWKRCLTDEAHTVSGLGIDEVINEILGQKSEHRSGELQARFSTTHQSLLRWRDSGELKGEIRSHVLWITRASLVAFLKARRIGA